MRFQNIFFSCVIAGPVIAVVSITPAVGCVADYVQRAFVDCEEGRIPLPDHIKPIAPPPPAPAVRTKPVEAPAPSPQVQPPSTRPPAAPEEPPQPAPRPNESIQAALPPPPPKPDIDATRSRFYDTILGYVSQRRISRGKLKYRGMRFGEVYRLAAKPKALAVCVNWSDSTPWRLNFLGKGSFQFVTGTGDCAPKSASAAKACAIRECEQYARCGKGVCVPIDVNDQNVLAIPKEWARRHTQ